MDHAPKLANDGSSVSEPNSVAPDDLVVSATDGGIVADGNPTSEVSRREFVSSLAASFAYATNNPEFDLLAEVDRRLAQTTSAANPTPAKEWHELPDLFAMVSLIFLRNWLRNANLYDTEEPPLSEQQGPIPAGVKHARTMDGTLNDLTIPQWGPPAPAGAQRASRTDHA